MKKQIGELTIELSGNQILIRETKSNMLLKAKDFQAYEVMDKFKSICSFYESRDTDWPKVA